MVPNEHTLRSHCQLPGPIASLTGLLPRPLRSTLRRAFTSSGAAIGHAWQIVQNARDSHEVGAVLTHGLLTDGVSDALAQVPR